MRLWDRVIWVERCGRCNVVLHRGAPMQRITLSGLRRRLIRCGDCASGPVPSDLPELVVQTPDEPSRVHWAPTQALATDWKIAQSGDK